MTSFVITIYYSSGVLKSQCMQVNQPNSGKSLKARVDFALCNPVSFHARPCSGELRSVAAKSKSPPPLPKQIPLVFRLTPPFKPCDVSGMSRQQSWAGSHCGFGSAGDILLSMSVPQLTLCSLKITAKVNYPAGLYICSVCIILSPSPLPLAFFEVSALCHKQLCCTKIFVLDCQHMLSVCALLPPLANKTPVPEQTSGIIQLSQSSPSVEM